MNQREIFLRHVAQTSASPLALEIVHAEGCFLTDKSGKKYLDLIGGISVANTGHRHPDVLDAIKKQLDAYLHIMVYGEFVETPQVQYAKLICDHLPSSLDSVYFTNSGAEAVEGAMKLAKRVTNRTKIIAFDNSYHGSTQGALSILGSENWRNAFRPLLPGITHAVFNDNQVIDIIDEDTACVIVETIQAEAGIVVPSHEWLKALSAKCKETGTLLILDEIQCGFGRTGTLWAFQQFDIEPDVLLLGKALGGGLPLGAFISSSANMKTLTEKPVLGHITTFGGHPLSCAAGLAAMQVLLKENIVENVRAKSELFRKSLIHPRIKSVRSQGLWFAVQFESFEVNKKIIDQCIESGILTDWFLFAADCLRISPPLTITTDQIKHAVSVLLEVIEG